MPKRRRHSSDFDKIRRKIRKLERDLYRARDESCDDSREGRDYYYSDDSDTNSIRHESDNSLDADIYGDLLGYPPPRDSEVKDSDVPASLEPVTAPITEPAAASLPLDNAAPTPELTNSILGESTTAVTSAPQATDSTEEVSQQETTEVLDSSILEILGADPAAGAEYGKEIHKELASRLEHMATMGISNEMRKELSEKYLIPANCTKVGAPLMNAEIKAAVTDIVMKRDRGIEMRQKQIAGAISGLATIITKELESKEKDSDRLKQLMDVSRILCDVQHNESVTRRNFAIYSIKKELKDHITNAKIDKYLFGESLAETLKAAKAVSKSGTDLKIKSQVGPRGPKPSTSSSNHLNWKPRAPARRQQGPQRSREPAQPATPGPSARYTRAPMHGNSLKTSQPPQRHYRRR